MSSCNLPATRPQSPLYPICMSHASEASKMRRLPVKLSMTACILVPGEAAQTFQPSLPRNCDAQTFSNFNGQTLRRRVFNNCLNPRIPRTRPLHRSGHFTAPAPPLNPAHEGGVFHTSMTGKLCPSYATLLEGINNVLLLFSWSQNTTTLVNFQYLDFLVHRCQRKSMTPMSILARGAPPTAYIQLMVVHLPEAKRGFVLMPTRWIVERSFSWSACF